MPLVPNALLPYRHGHADGQRPHEDKVETYNITATDFFRKTHKKYICNHKQTFEHTKPNQGARNFLAKATNVTGEEKKSYFSY